MEILAELIKRNSLVFRADNASRASVATNGFDLNITQTFNKFRKAL